jgi:hypothetical protein
LIIDGDRTFVIGIDRIFGGAVIQTQFHCEKLPENDNFFKEHSNMGANTL